MIVGSVDLFLLFWCLLPFCFVEGHYVNYQVTGTVTFNG